MRILLVVYDNGAYIHCFPQGLSYVAAVLQKEGFEVEVYSQDMHHWPDEHLTRHLDENRYDAVGVSVIGGYYQYRKLLSLSDAIHRSKQKPFYVLGGHGPVPAPEYFFKKTGFDALVMGEGEETAVELFKALSRGSSLRSIKGIAYRDGETLRVNPRRPLIQDIDSIPWPAYSLFPMEYYRLLRIPRMAPSDFSMTLLSGRGCTFQCNFCYRMDKGLRPRDPERIADEIEFLQKQHQINFITFSDELLMSSEQRTVEVCRTFLRRKLGIRWDCNGRLNYAKRDVLGLMKEAGCVFINYGIEAFDDRILKNMRKGLTTKQITAGVEATLEVGISPGLNIIFGNIGEDRETLRKGMEFLLKYDDGAQLRTIRPVTPYPGSPLFDHAVQKGLVKDVADFYENKHMNSDLLSVNFTDMSDEEFHQALYEANKTLIENHYARQAARTLAAARKLYLEKDPAFRGFRQT
ncbi:MAG TPA: B12-binding domain-containing radical SAM protein [Elusimicrobia bacterium]|nr:B12-binding domain-containing radical SAM protein [Elusimicrobiota bacterium]